MSTLGLKPHRVDKFNGLFDRGEDEVAPVDHAVNVQNNEYTHLGVQTRKGTEEFITASSIVRAYRYERIGEVIRYIVLDTSGKFWDSAIGFTPGDEILTIASATDFSMVVMYERAYITPHNGTKGLSGEFLYVYEGSGVARKAAGDAPTGFTLTVDEGSEGNIEEGKHLFAVAFETSSGHITQAGPDEFTLLEATGGKKVNISDIPIGPAGTVGRYLLASPVLPEDWNGDQNATTVEMYFIPGGHITNNEDTSLNDVDFFDSSLIDSADYLLDEMNEIPAGVGLADYKGSLIIWGEDTEPSRVRVSKANDIESFNNVTGFLLCHPAVGGGVLDAVELHGQLYMMKRSKTYVTRSNGAEPATWSLDDVDLGRGTSSSHGVGIMLDTQGVTVDKFVVADISGLLGFNGAYLDLELSFKVQNIWKRITKTAFSKIQVVVDSRRERIYIPLPLDGEANPSVLLVGDFQNGFNAEMMRWDLWVFPWDPTSVAIDKDSSDNTQLAVFSLDGNGYRQRDDLTNDDNVAINAFYEIAPFSFSKDYLESTLVDVHVFCRGSGVLEVHAYNWSRTYSATIGGNGFNLSDTPDFNCQGPFVFVADQMSIRFEVDAIDEYYSLNKVRLWGYESGKANVAS